MDNGDFFVTPVNHSIIDNSDNAREWALRVDLAAAFRLAAQFDWHESVGNHFSAAISDDGKTFLLNPKWKHFATIRASDLLRLNAADQVMDPAAAPDRSAWCIHSHIHAALPQARVLLHCHPPYLTALSALDDPAIKPIDLTTARFYNRIAIDTDCNGIVDNALEGQRIAASFGNQMALLMRNHGVSVIGQSIAEAFECLYYLERAAKTMVLAYSTGQPLRIMDAVTAERIASEWKAYRGMAAAHFEQQKDLLRRRDASFCD